MQAAKLLARWMTAALLLLTAGRATADGDEKILSFETMTGLNLVLAIGCRVYFAETLETFLQDLNRARPTLFVSVPRLWLKFQAGVYSKMPPKKFNTLMKIPILSGLVRKKVDLPSLHALLVETTILVPLALAGLAWLPAGSARGGRSGR